MNSLLYTAKPPKRTRVPDRRARMCGRNALFTLIGPAKFVFINSINMSALSPEFRHCPLSQDTYEQHLPQLLAWTSDCVGGIVDNDVNAAPVVDCLLRCVF